VCARKRRRAQQAAAEARTFFVGPIDDTNGDRRTAVELLGEAAENFEGREDVEGAIEPAAIRNRIEMAAEKKGFVGGAGERGPVVAGSIVMMLDGKLLEFLGVPFAGAEPGVGPGDALGSVVVGGEGAEFVEFL
jgi:hypothetical protein